MKKYLEPEFNMSVVNFSTDTCDTISGTTNQDTDKPTLPIIPAN